MNIKFSAFRPNLEDKAILGQSSGGQHQSTGRLTGCKLGGEAHGSLLPAEDIQVGL